MKGRKLGRSPSHRKAMLKNLASSLFLSERDAEVNEVGEVYTSYQTPGFGRNVPKVKGRVVTTLEKAKQVRPLVEKCITIARHALRALEAAEEFATSAKRNSEAWKSWRRSEQWQSWNQAIAPAVAARRRAIRLLGNKHAVSILFDDIAPRFTDRDGGYTRILRLAKQRVGDAGTRALLEFVGRHDRVRQESERPAFDEEEVEQDQPVGESENLAEEKIAAEQTPADEMAAEEASKETSSDEQPAGEDDPAEENTSL